MGHKQKGNVLNCSEKMLEIKSDPLNNSCTMVHIHVVSFLIV